MNNLLIFLGIESWKPILAALLLPPLPLLVLVLVGARQILPRRGLGWLIVLTSVLLLWLSACTGMANVLTQFVLHPPPAFNPDRIAALKAEVQAKQPVAIVVLGGGAEPFAPEYGVSSLTAVSLERLRYGVWLSRETGAPLAFSGGIGWAQTDAKPEAQIAGQIAAQEFGRPLKWMEDRSRDTRENALRSIALLKPAGITHIVLVTHGWHMPRAQRDFEEAAAATGIRIDAAPMGLARKLESPVRAWMPSANGYIEVNRVLRELLGRIAGA